MNKKIKWREEKTGKTKNRNEEKQNQTEREKEKKVMPIVLLLFFYISCISHLYTYTKHMINLKHFPFSIFFFSLFTMR